MKRILLILTILLLIPLSPIGAQDELPTEEVGVEAQGEGVDEVIRTSDLFDVEIEVGTQSPWTKRVPVTIRFRATIDADEVGISWDAPVSLDVQEKHDAFISVVKGEVYTATANILSDRAGAYDIAGNVTAWQYNTNYTSSASTSLTFDEDGITVPQTLGYTGAIAVKYAALGLLTIIGAVLLVFGGKVGFKKLKIWLTPPN